MPAVEALQKEHQGNLMLIKLNLLKLLSKEKHDLTESRMGLQRGKQRMDTYRVCRTGVRSGLTEFVNLAGC